MIKNELRYSKHEYLDNYFNLARATEEKLQQMSDKVEATDGERDKNIKKDMQEMKQRYDAVNSQLGSLETRMDTMRRDQAESSCAIQAAKLDAILRKSTRCQGGGRPKTIMKSGTANTTSGPGDSTTYNNAGPDAMTWASTWEIMNRTLEAFATRNTESSERGG